MNDHESNFGIHSTRVLFDGKLQQATVVINEGKIDFVVPGDIKAMGLRVTDYKDWVIMPGIIDSHVHINEPGRTEWEGFETATKAAAAGGITTLVDMPLNSSPVTVSKLALEEKVAASRGKLHVNCGLYAGLIPDRLDELDALLSEGVLGVKAFLTHSGIDEFPNVTEEDLRKALPIIRKHRATLLVHCELESENPDADLLKNNPESYQAYLKSRPRKWEDDAVALMIRLCKEFDVRIHVVHLSSSDSIQQLEEAQRNGIKITVETCPQYLCLNAEMIPDGATQFKCAPPIREWANNELLWNALRDGLISFVVTDHSPAPPEIKELESGNFGRAWGGIASLQFSLPVFWTAAKSRGFTISEVARLMAQNVAEFLELEFSKGKIEEGYDADLVIWDPEEEFTIKNEDILFRHPVTAYEGMKVKGVVKRTMVGGSWVYAEGEDLEVNGQLIFREH